ncbi:hypothetical protein ABLE91_02815 [Aquabacter sp. CN5-332]|uniref:hypothetical protein n=1 Tax=Aquabacter sp. CN5-332 TaxID=3156608 RepID=UPI0032B410C0
MALSLCLSGPAFLSASAWAIELKVDGPETVIFDQRTQACDASDLPDAPARAFRDDQGRMVLFAPNFKNRAFTGPDLRHLTKDCTVRFAASGSADPAMLDDRTWLHGFFTADGRNVFAFASASFIPYRHGGACAAGPERTACWRNGIAALLSTDGGKTFHYSAPPPRQTVMPPETAFNPQVKDPEGFVSTTNIVAWNGDLYAIVWRRAGEAGKSRNCLVRAPKGDVDRWEMWTGEGFAPLAERMADGWKVEGLDCAPIGPKGLPSIRGLVRHEASGEFVAVFQMRGRKGAPDGFYTVTSKDLISWSEPSLLAAVPLRGGREDEGEYSGYPSLIDDQSPDRNFGTVGTRADLVFVRFETDASGKRPKRVRELVALPLRVSP